MNGGVPAWQFVQLQHSEGIKHVAARVDIEIVQRRLLRGHVLRRADHSAEPGVKRAVGQLLAGRLGDSEVDHLGDGPVIVERDHHIGRLNVAMDDPFLVGVLNGMANGDEQLEALPDGSACRHRSIR